MKRKSSWLKLIWLIGFTWLLLGCRAEPERVASPSATATRFPMLTSTQTGPLLSATPTAAGYPAAMFTPTVDANPELVLMETATSMASPETPLPTEAPTLAPAGVPTETAVPTESANATPPPYPGYVTPVPTLDPYPAASSPTPVPTNDPYPGQQPPTATPLPVDTPTPTPTGDIPWPTESATPLPTADPFLPELTPFPTEVITTPDITTTLMISVPRVATPFREMQVLPESSINALVFSPNGLQLGLATSTGAYLYSTARLEKLAAINVGVPITQIAYLPGGQYLVTGSLSGRLEWWQIDSNDYQGRLGRHIMGITGLGFNSLGNLLVSGGDDHLVKIWDTSMVVNAGIDAGRLQHRLSGFNSRITALALSPSGQYLAVGAYNQLQIWNPVTGSLIQELPGVSGWVNEIVFSPDERLMVTADASRRLQIWQLADWSRTAILVLDGIGSIQALAFRPDGGLLACGHANGGITLWDPNSGEFQSYFQAHTKKVTTLAFNDAGGLLASSSSDGWVKIWQPGMLLP